MGNPSNGNSGSDRIKTDRGGIPFGDNGQRPVPPSSPLPELKKPKK